MVLEDGLRGTQISSPIPFKDHCQPNSQTEDDEGIKLSESLQRRKGKEWT